MKEFMQYLIPVLTLSGLAAAWMGVQLLARKMKVKNHIDHGGCCGACGSGTNTCSSGSGIEKAKIRKVQGAKH